MRILAIDKYEEPVVKEIENNLKDMQRYVLGHIETITLCFAQPFGFACRTSCTVLSLTASLVSSKSCLVTSAKHE